MNRRSTLTLLALFALLALAGCGGGDEPPREITDLDRAQRLCTLLAGAAMTCDVNTFAGRIEAVIARGNEAEAENLCAMVTQQMAQISTFERPWELELSSPESIRPVATCRLQ